GVTIYGGNYGGAIFTPRSVGPTFVQLAIDPPNAASANSVGLPLATNGVWTCPSRPGLPVYEAGVNHYNIGYQYFGGISSWQNPVYNGPSRSPVNLNTAQPHWALAADAVVKVNGAWGGNDPSRPYVYANIPPHCAENSPVPQGGNQAFVDGSVRWIQAEKMYFLSSWDSSGRLCYWYQDTKDFPASLKTFLPALRFQP
ncbi:MAG TPA: prepilin-type cleavage/methylation domain-containing protein, partial [Verrucomicrobiae bacterium]|nr:prepilin-type cleavage/methylation domain-containing protein [Verrucomicrobiae bacterium]